MERPWAISSDLMKSVKDLLLEESAYVTQRMDAIFVKDRLLGKKINITFRRSQSNWLFQSRASTALVWWFLKDSSTTSLRRMLPPNIQLLTDLLWLTV